MLIEFKTDETLDAELEAAIRAYYPIPTQDDPNWEDPKDGSSPPQVEIYDFATHLVTITYQWWSSYVNRYRADAALQALEKADVEDKEVP